jgi:hypothetical protein
MRLRGVSISHIAVNPEENMKTLHRVFGALAVSGALALSSVPASAAPTKVPEGGDTSVELAPSFLAALASLSVTPEAISPARIDDVSTSVFASFPITTGEIDLGTLKAEIDHEGGLSLNAGKTSVKLTAFIIDLTGKTPVLTGLVTVDNNLVGRLPLFELNLADAAVDTQNYEAIVSKVGVTLSATAAAALNKIFNIAALTDKVVIGTATVRTFVAR